MPSLPDWQLPPGVNRGLWAYLNDADLARSYDTSLVDSPLIHADVAFAQEHFKLPGKLIDLGCGTGRLALHFARLGYWSLGVDLSAEMLRVLGDKANQERVNVHRLQCNLVDLRGLDEATFDYAACLFSTLGMIQGQGNRRQVIEQVYRLLRPGGRFVLHVHNRWFNAWTGMRGWLIKDTLRSIFKGQSGGDCVMPPHQGLPAITLHLFTRKEICCLMRGSGFHLLEFRSLGLGKNGQLFKPLLFPGMRSYGYLIAGEKPRS